MSENGGDHFLECYYCSDGMKEKSDLIVHIKNHLRAHTGEKKAFKELGFLLKTHTREKPYVCISCHKGFVHKKWLINHMRTHSSEEPLRGCSYDQNVLPIRQNLKTVCDEEQYDCFYCGKKFNIKIDLANHLGSHTEFI